MNYQPYKGVDWSASLSRPGCQDHLKHPSRRGDDRVPHHNGNLVYTGSAVQPFATNAREGYTKK